MEYRVNTKGLVLPNDETHVDWFLLAIAERLERIAELMEQGQARNDDADRQLEQQMAEQQKHHADYLKARGVKY